MAKTSLNPAPDHAVLPLKPPASMPSSAPLRMPVQDFGRAPDGVRRDPPSTRVILARLIAFGGAMLLTAFALYGTLRLVSGGGITVLEASAVVLFTISFAWIALAATSALSGFLAPPICRVGPAADPQGDGAEKLKERIALVMPIFHEDAVRVTAALAAMAHGLQAQCQAHAFEIVILSDSTRADAWPHETLAVQRLRDALHGVMPVWYRRRWANTSKKPGNIRDFVEGWGARYGHFVLLDADSLMAPATLIALARAMDADPRLGILQTVPVLSGGRTLYARLQQFAGSVYGPVMARGLAAWQGFDGIYWGHNAIIRMAAFAGACGLPRLPGKRPLGGDIMSHDFVEAALIRRAGWRVELAPCIGGSWEESPPSLLDAAARDRRWTQGNLQHSRVLPARGLAGVSRMHLLMGIMSYAAAPVWLLLIVCGFALSLQARLLELPGGESPTAFSQSHPEWLLRLFVLTLFVLLVPKLLGLARAVLTPELRRGCGGAFRMTASFVVELILSAVMAPLMMAMHSRHIGEILAGRDVGWSAQRRDGEGVSWREAWLRHRWHTLWGAALVIAAAFLADSAWMFLSPGIAGLLLAVLLSKASGSIALGRRLGGWKLLVTPEELRPDPVLIERERLCSLAPDLSKSPILSLVPGDQVRTAA